MEVSFYTLKSTRIMAMYIKMKRKQVQLLQSTLLDLEASFSVLTVYFFFKKKKRYRYGISKVRYLADNPYYFKRISVDAQLQI